MNEGIKSISINVEYGKHIDKVYSLIKKEKPDVICFQEILKEEFEFFRKKLKMNGISSSLGIFPKIEGVRNSNKYVYTAILTKFDILKKYSFRYNSYEPDIFSFQPKNSRPIVIAEVIKNKKVYRVANTHFTHLKKTYTGQTDNRQRKALRQMLKILKQFDYLILMGDFNSPRGGEIFGRISRVYKDNIPKKYDSSLDPKLFKLPELKLMIDGLFTTPEYVASEVKLVGNVSDHMAVVANVCRID
jgi:endonuclease/exonuclease/phosphatase family metal-dependent hydrolase